MKSLAIIGTAGRRDDADRLSRGHFDAMTDVAYGVIQETGATHLVSGGAAWADHVAVRLVLEGAIPADHLTLFLPAALGVDGFTASRDGQTANYYHRKFSAAARIDSIAELNEVRRRGATLIVNPAGFFARNAQVASSADALLAFTFGEGPAWKARRFGQGTSADEAGLKNGGTAHTFSRSRAATKIHVPLGPVELAPAPAPKRIVAAPGARGLTVALVTRKAVNTAMATYQDVSWETPELAFRAALEAALPVMLDAVSGNLADLKSRLGALPDQKDLAAIGRDAGDAIRRLRRMARPTRAGAPSPSACRLASIGRPRRAKSCARRNAEPNAGAEARGRMDEKASTSWRNR